MRKNFSTRLFAALSVLCASALAPEMAAAQDEPANAGAPAMWRISDADTELTMLGTFHILPAGLEWRTPTMNAAFDAADRVYFEVETDSAATQQRTLNIVMTRGFNPNGALLTEKLSAEDADAFKAIVQSLGLPLAGVDPMRPWNAFLTLSVQFIIAQGFDPGAGVESVLVKEARTKGKELRFFETIEEQMSFFTTLPEDVELALLEMTVRQWNEQVESFDAVFQAWRTGDDTLIDAELNAVMARDAPEVYARLMLNRNEAWTEELTRVMNNESGKIFVAVGAGHLVGDRSVPAMLAENGFTVERIAHATSAANDNQPGETETPSAAEQ